MQDASQGKLLELWDKGPNSAVEADRSCFCVVNGEKNNNVRDKDGEMEGKSHMVHPLQYRAGVLSLAHGGLFAGHQERTKTVDRYARDLFWVGMYRNVEGFCKTCAACWISGESNQRIAPSCLHPISVPT